MTKVEFDAIFKECTIEATAPYFDKKYMRPILESCLRSDGQLDAEELFAVCLDESVKFSQVLLRTVLERLLPFDDEPRK